MNVIKQTLWSDLYSAVVMSSDEATLGRVGQVYLDDDTGEPTWVSVVLDRTSADEALVPLRGAALDAGTMRLAFSSEFIRKAPHVEAADHLSEDKEYALITYYLHGGPHARPSVDAAVEGHTKTGHLWSAPIIREHDAGVLIEGVTGLEAQEALALLRAAKGLQFELGSSAAGGLLRALLVEAKFELTPPAPVEQARRLAELRQALLATPVYTNESLGEIRGDERSSTTRTWVSRMRRLGRIFTVRLEGRTIIPAFQLTDEGEPRPEIQSVIEPLLDAGVDGWALWVWLTTPTPLLSGGKPVDVVENDVDRVARAASRFAARRVPAA